MKPSNDIEALMSLVAKLPGLGPRSARRVVLHLLRKRETLVDPLLFAMEKVRQNVKICSQCGNLDTHDPCTICTDSRRDGSTLCVVEDMADLWAVERLGFFRGRYHVLGGTLSAIDGRGPDQLRIPTLLRRAGSDDIKEVILATNATVEGQTTAHYLTDALVDSNVRITRLAQGIPIGGELDYLDEGTLGAALRSRQAF